MTSWRTRLIEAIDADGRSDRAISLAAKLGPNFVNELRNQNKEASVSKVLALAEQVHVSAGFLFTGLAFSTQDEEVLRAFLALGPEQRQALLTLARQLAGA